MFQIGDMVVHSHRGAAQIVDVEKLNCLGSGKDYYALELVKDTETRVWVSVQDAENGMLRQPLAKATLARVWHIFQTKPHELPSDHKERYQELEAKLHSGDPLQVAKAMRDLTWKNAIVRALTIEGKRLHQRCIDHLSSEIAVAQGDSLESVKAKIEQVLNENIAARAPA